MDILSIFDVLKIGIKGLSKTLFPHLFCTIICLLVCLTLCTYLLHPLRMNSSTIVISVKVVNYSNNKNNSYYNSHCINSRCSFGTCE